MLIGQFTSYKGYIGSIEYNPEDKFKYYGSIQNTTDFVNYSADSLLNLEVEFHSAVDDYIEFIKDDILIRAARNANLSTEILKSTFEEKGVMGIYILGQQHMLEYIGGINDGTNEN